jgi:3-oxoacyl-[acyl-carrier protein] reductase
MKMRLKGRVAIVTGGAKGLGRAFAIRLAQEGANLMVVTRKDMDNLEKTVRQVQDLGGKASLFQADVKAMAKAAIDEFGKIDILVNNAAIYDGIKRRPFYEIDLDEWDLVMTVNVKGALLSARAVFPYMKEQGYGKIVNLASEVFFTGSHGFAHYVASKGGIIGLTRALAVELGPHNICINCVDQVRYL